MKNNKYTKALIILVAICYSTFLFGCNSKTNFDAIYPDPDGESDEMFAYADGTNTAEEGHHHHHHDDEDEHDEHDEHDDHDDHHDDHDD